MMTTPAFNLAQVPTPHGGARLLLMPPDAVRERMAAAACGGNRAERLAERRGEPGRVEARGSLRAELGLHQRPATERVGAVSVVRIDAGTYLQPDIVDELLGESVAIGRVVDQLAEAAADPATHTVLVRINSPGGSVAGQSDLLAGLEAVKAAGKRVVGLANDQATSAAQWLLAACDIALATPTAMVGSVGAITALVDTSVLWNRIGLRSVVVASGPAKAAAGTPGQPITEADVAEVGRLIGQLGGMFAADVARRRGLSAGQLKEVSTARVYTAAEGLRHGLIDGIVAGGEGELLKALQDKQTNPAGGAGARSGKPTARAPRSTSMDLATLTAEHPDLVASIRAGALAEFGGADGIRAAIASGKPATLAELEAAFPNSPGFVLSQLRAGASVLAAKVAHAEQVGVELKAKDAELTAARAKITELEATLATRRVGAPPVGVKPAAGAGGDVIAEVEARVEAVKAEKGVHTNKAHSLVKAENPRRYAEYLQAQRDERRPGRR